jgi:hypothetical protein
MSYQIRARDLRVKVFRSNTVKDMESKINTWLANCEEEFEVVDIIYERHHSPLVEKAVSTALILFRIV